MTYSSKRNQFFFWQAIGVFSISIGLLNGAMAQSDQALLLVGANPGVGIGVYNSVGIAGGLDLRYQYPLGKNLALIVKTGIDGFRIKGRYVSQIQDKYQTVTGFSIPLAVGPRYYFMQGIYGGVNLGVDIGISRLSSSSFRFEPGVGAVIPLKAGGYLDAGISIVTSFSRGSGIFSFNVAYGLQRRRIR